jgi:excisionase family DNA binding protein
MGHMPDRPPPGARLLAPAQVAELLGVSVEDVVSLVHEGRLRGMRVGSPARWRVEESSVEDYLADQAEEARRMALWRQSNAASFPELWGRGPRGER